MHENIVLFGAEVGKKRTWLKSLLVSSNTHNFTADLKFICAFNFNAGKFAKILETQNEQIVINNMQMHSRLPH